MCKFNDLFAYCKRTGVLTYKKKCGIKMPGQIAGSVNKNNYINLGIEKKRYYAHRIIWEMHNGTIPDGYQVDHINGIRSDNRIENLRIVKNSENSKNQKRKSTNKSGMTGVSWDTQTQRWRAHITVNGKMISLGRYIHKLDALTARKNAEIKYNFHENHGR
ncbi:HNH endonuclease [Escherichia coli]|uniref:HNH endonuclease signature motif containing protein n=1 Tax=Escherichia coli TaxID=562 RepID=UPI00056FEB4B|nr:HNH endonuclease signature motif containing protein [Escherichia coli]EFC9528522.1 HNH endonuclease [Escherichia coli]